MQPPSGAALPAPSQHRLLLGRTGSAVDAALAVHSTNATTIMDEMEVVLLLLFTHFLK